MIAVLQTAITLANKFTIQPTVFLTGMGQKATTGGLIETVRF
jgi:hypothetical protein